MALKVDSYDAETETRTGSMKLQCPQYARDTEVESDCTFGLHGGTSRWYEKQSYKLKLAKKSPLLGMRNDEDWVLNALYDDAGLIHNKLSYDLWNEMADSNDVKNDNSAHTEYVELLIKGEYRGVYLLTERVDRKMLSLSGNDILYKCVEWWGGESDNDETYGLDSSYEIKYPEEARKEQWLPLKEYNDVFNGKKEVTYDEAADLVDINSVIDYELFCQVSYGWDSLLKNTYFAAEYENGRYIIKKLPWDLNIGWGNKWVWNEDCNYNIYDRKSVESTGMWCPDAAKLLELDRDRTTELLLKRYRSLRKDIFTEEHISELAEKDLALLHNSGAYERNYARWPHGSKYWKEDFLFDYISGRLKFLDEYLKDPQIGEKEQ
jgi:spore coat protein CotH